MARSLRAALLGILVVACTGSLAHAGSKVALQLRGDHQFRFAGYYAARWQGYYAEAGIEVEIRPGIAPDRRILSPIAEVAAGRAEFGIGGADILTGRDQGLPLVILASILSRSDAALVALDRTPLGQPRDLLGLTMARTPGDAIDVETRAMLVAAGLDPEAITSRPRRPGLADLLDGMVDVIQADLAGASFQLARQGVGFAILQPQDHGIDFYGDSLFTREGLLKRDPHLVQRFKAASLRGWEYALDHPEAIAARIARELPRTVPLDDRLAFELSQAKEVQKLSDYPRVEVGHINPARWQHMADTLKRLGLIAAPLDAQALIFDPAAHARAHRLRTGGLALLAAALALLAMALAWLKSVRRAVAQATAELKASETRFRDFAETASDWFWEQDAELRFAYFSDNFAQMTGIAPEALLGRRREDVRLALPNSPDWQQHVWDLQARRPFRGFVYPYRDASGAIRWVEISGRPVFDGRGVFQGYRGTGHEVTLRVEAARRLQERAYHDPLTGMPNRLMLETRLAAALGCMRCLGGSVALLLIDLDGFKLVNDRHGHPVGDRLLTAWAERLGMTVRAADCVARLGGDEFAVILTLKGPNADARSVAERIVASAAQPFSLEDGLVLRLGASVGIALAPRDAGTMVDLLACADQALYRAKTAGRGCFASYGETGAAAAMLPPASACALVRLHADAAARQEPEQRELSPVG